MSGERLSPPSALQVEAKRQTNPISWQLNNATSITQSWQEIFASSQLFSLKRGSKIARSSSSHWANYGSVVVANNTKNKNCKDVPATELDYLLHYLIQYSVNIEYLFFLNYFYYYLLIINKLSTKLTVFLFNTLQYPTLMYCIII